MLSPAEMNLSSWEIVTDGDCAHLLRCAQMNQYSKRQLFVDMHQINDAMQGAGFLYCRRRRDEFNARLKSAMLTENKFFRILIGSQHIRKPRPTTWTRQSALASPFSELPNRAIQVLQEAKNVAATDATCSMHSDLYTQALQWQQAHGISHDTTAVHHATLQQRG
jgi:hypothetical protein